MTTENSQSPQIPLERRSDLLDDDIDLWELWIVLWEGKWLISVTAAIALTASVTFALLQTEIYRAEAILAPADEEQAVGGLAGQFGGAAALLGVNIGASGNDKISTAIAIMNSREFIGRFIDEHQLLVPLFAGSWEKDIELNVIDPNKYDEANQQWALKTGQPTRQEAYRKFKEVLTISDPDRTTGLVTVAINWHDPEQASDWVNQIVVDVNRDLRLRDVSEANKAINFLRAKLESTSLVEMQRVFYQLIESQTRITMLADVRDEYIFRVIDPAVVPDKSVEPRRSLICLIGALLGCIVGVILVFFRKFVTNRR